MNWAERLVISRLRVLDFTAFFGVDDPQGLADVLRQQETTQPYQDVYGLHALRWMLFDPARGADSQRQALVLSMIVDGTPADVLASLAQTKAATLRQVLSHCHGFNADTPIVDYLKRHATPSGHLFRDLGPLSEEDHAEPEPDATRAEVQQAHEAQRCFEHLYLHHSQGISAAELRAAFKRKFTDHAFPFPLTHFEKQQPDEQTWGRRMLDVIRRRQVFAAVKTQDGQIRRGAHAKGHGLIRATFRVKKSAFRVGLFSAEATYPAILRLSNSAPELARDRVPDARGLALRVLIPRGEGLADDELSSLVEPQQQADVVDQDFVLMDSPVFPVRDIRRLTLLFRTFVSGSTLDKAVGLAGLALSPGGLRETGLVVKSLRGLTRDPLAKAYHSTTPYLLGPSHIAKYSLEPIEKQSFRAWASDRRSPSTAAILRQRLSKGDVRMRFFVHVFSDGERPNGMSLPDVVEDATLDWGRLKARKVHVADVEIPRQDPATDECMREAEQLQFNPWNALQAHRPLGSLNRARWLSYRASQQFRAPAVAVANALSPEPTSIAGPSSVPAPVSQPKAAE